jgi:hypothetical protein
MRGLFYCVYLLCRLGVVVVWVSYVLFFIVLFIIFCYLEVVGYGVVGGRSSSAIPVQSVFQRVQLLHPSVSDISTERKYRLQLRLHNIDSTRFELSAYKGFRNYVKAKCTEIGLSGYVWRVTPIPPDK